jgi:CHAT domain-containing protein
MIDLGKAEHIDEMIAAFRAAIAGGERTLRPSEPLPAANINDGADLRRAVFDPLASALAGRNRLFLCPDGDLTRLPFETLPTGDGRRLIDDYQISYLGTGRDLLRFGIETVGQPASPLVIADPDFDLGIAAPVPAGETRPRGRQSRTLDRGALHFDPLPGTRGEGEHIAAHLGVQPWLQGNALKGRLKVSPSPRILHIATHGFFLEDQKRDAKHHHLGVGVAGTMVQSPFGRLSQGMENPLLRSGLALAGANTWLQGKPLPAEAEDGILTAEDVSGLDLLGTELVVLSACETGLGAVHVGEGVFGLGRSFVLAGAKTLVMSLWKVPDQQTQELMEDFYRRILMDEPRADALRAAQLAMKEKYPEPLYWGAFICQGEPAALQRK